jgi:diguanylate cyclase (GGDEF)-like protein
MLDLDDFRAFNDSHGHSRGDDVLRAASSVVRSSLRDMDVAARYGGGQFAIILPETGSEGALAVADRIRLAVAALDGPVEGHDGASCTVSAGVATYPEDAQSAQRLVEIAELALCKAKRLGKNRVNTDRPCSAVDPS